MTRIKTERYLNYIRKLLKEDILDRYNNEEYWYDDIKGKNNKKQDILDRYDNEEYWDEDLAEEYWRIKKVKTKTINRRY